MNENHFIINPNQISGEALNNIIKEYILREGTDYGVKDHTFEKKKQEILTQLKMNKILILFDAELGSCNLITNQEFKNQFT